MAQQVTLTPCYPNSPMAASPLANSTRIHQNSEAANSTNIIINNYNQIVINETTTLTGEKVRKPRKPIGGSKKPVVVTKKPLAPKKTTSNLIVKSGNNVSNVSKKLSSVERILNQINMGKYANLFKNCDIDKFKEMRELDLNAMGITRPQEIRILKEAISKAKSDSINTLV